MNEVHLKGSLYQTPTSTWVSGVKEAWIWLNADGQSLPVLCRGPLADAACQCQPGVLVEVTGSVERIQDSADTWSLRILGTGLLTSVLPPQTATVRADHQPRNTDRDEEDCDDPNLVEIAPGFYWDGSEHEYVGDPDALDDCGDDEDDWNDEGDDGWDDDDSADWEDQDE